MKNKLRVLIVSMFFSFAFFNVYVSFEQVDNELSIQLNSVNEAKAFTRSLGFADFWTGYSVSYEYDMSTGCLTTTTVTYDMKTCHNSQSLCFPHQNELSTTEEVDCVAGPE